jgi:hypothetical protein
MPLPRPRDYAAVLRSPALTTVCACRTGFIRPADGSLARATARSAWTQTSDHQEGCYLPLLVADGIHSEHDVVACELPAGRRQSLSGSGSRAPTAPASTRGKTCAGKFELTVDSSLAFIDGNLAFRNGGLAASEVGLV